MVKIATDQPALPHHDARPPRQRLRGHKAGLDHTSVAMTEHAISRGGRPLDLDASSWVIGQRDRVVRHGHRRRCGGWAGVGRPMVKRSPKDHDEARLSPIAGRGSSHAESSNCPCKTPVGRSGAQARSALGGLARGDRNVAIAVASSRRGRERMRSSAGARLPRCGNQASRPYAMSWEGSRNLATCDRALPARVNGHCWITPIPVSPVRSPLRTRSSSVVVGRDARFPDRVLAAGPLMASASGPARAWPGRSRRPVRSGSRSATRCCYGAGAVTWIFVGERTYPGPATGSLSQDLPLSRQRHSSSAYRDR
jgi:hypothetical protein